MHERQRLSRHGGAQGGRLRLVVHHRKREVEWRHTSSGDFRRDRSSSSGVSIVSAFFLSFGHVGSFSLRKSARAATCLFDLLPDTGAICRSPKARSASLLPKEGSGAPQGANQDGCSVEHPAGDSCRLALRRSTAVFRRWGPSASPHCHGYYPLALHGDATEDSIRRPLVGREAFSTRLPRHGLRDRARGHRTPSAFSSPRERPSANRDTSAILMRPGSVNTKI